MKIRSNDIGVIISTRCVERKPYTAFPLYIWMDYNGWINDRLINLTDFRIRFVVEGKP